MLSLLEKMHKSGRLFGKARAPMENICYILLVERVYGAVSVRIGSKDELKIIKKNRKCLIEFGMSSQVSYSKSTFELLPLEIKS